MAVLAASHQAAMNRRPTVAVMPLVDTPEVSNHHSVVLVSPMLPMVLAVVAAATNPIHQNKRSVNRIKHETFACRRYHLLTPQDDEINS